MDAGEKTEVKEQIEVSNGQDVPDVLTALKDFYDKDAGCAISPVKRNAAYYNMDHERRGHAVIFNHENFDIPNLKSRAGTSADCENLEKTLKSLGFEVAVYNDLKSSEVEKVLTKFSEQSHADCDSFLLAVLSHGEQGIIYAKDSAYKPDTLWSRFTADCCSTLAGKPKLFIIQACQGDKLDGGITMRSTEVDSGPSTFRLPVHADILIAYSTVPGNFNKQLSLNLGQIDESSDLRVDVSSFYSWRNTSRGSWFIQALCAELQENAYKYDLLTVLTFVNQRVALDFESYVPDSYRMHKQKQIPCITFMLTRLLMFKNKIKTLP